MQRHPDQRHLTEEYHYSARPSWAKLKASRVGWMDIGTTTLTLYAAVSILRQAIVGTVGWSDIIVFAVAGLLAQHYGSKVYGVLFSPISGYTEESFGLDAGLLTGSAESQQSTIQSWGDDISPWIAEIDRYEGNRDGEYHREFVCVGATSQPDAIAAVRYEYDASEDDIVYIRQWDPETAVLSVYAKVKSSFIWIDNRDDPIKVYTIERLRRGNAYHAHDRVSDTRIVGHTIAGLSNEWTRHADRTFVEMIVHSELHELSHWALDHEEQVFDPHEEIGWYDVHWDMIDYVQDGQPDGPWYDEEREKRVELTSREKREHATELNLST